MPAMNKHLETLVKAPASWEYTEDMKKKKDGLQMACKIAWATTSQKKPITSKQCIIRTGSQFGILVIDTDIKGNVNGYDELEKLGICLSDYDTLAFQSPSGGYHFFFKYEDKFDGWKADFLPCVDMIGNQNGKGWFVFHDLDHMPCIKNFPIANMPDDLYEALQSEHDLYKKLAKGPRSVESFSSTISESSDTDVENTTKISQKYFDLLSLLDDSWFQRYSKWIEPAYALHNLEDIDNQIAFNTWNQLLAQRAGSKYDYDGAHHAWFTTLPKSQNERKADNLRLITMAHFKKIIGGSRNEEYNSWKATYEPIKRKERIKTKADLKEEGEEQYDNIVEELCNAIKALGGSAMREKNDKSFANIQKLHRSDIELSDLALLINQTLVAIDQNASKYLIIKEIRYYRCKTTNTRKGNTVFTKIDFDKVVSHKYFTTIWHEGKSLKVNIKKLIFDLTADVLTYNAVASYPFGPKCIDNTPSDEFNIFTGFLHNYDENFVIDSTIVDTFLSMYREILCNNVEESFDFEIKKLAHIIQKPEIKTGAVSIFKAGQGVGKSFLLMFLMSYVFGKHLSITIYDKNQLTAKFNSHLMGKIFVILEEGVDLTSIGDISAFKGMTRCPTINIEYKGVNVEDTMDCCMNFYIATNSDYNRMFGESDERTANFNVCSEKYKVNVEFFHEMANILYNFDAGKHIFHYLANLDISDFKVQRVPEGDEKRRKKINSAPSFIRHLAKLHINDLDPELLEEFEIEGLKPNLISSISPLKSEDNYIGIEKIMAEYRLMCDKEFSCTPMSKAIIKENYLTKYFQDIKKRTYNFNKYTVAKALNAHFNTNKFT